MSNFLDDIEESMKECCDGHTCGDCPKEEDISCPYVPLVDFTDEQMLEWLRENE